MNNPKMKKVNIAIEKLAMQMADYQAKVKEQMSEFNAKMRELEKQKTLLENEEIIAMFRREKLNEETFAEIIQEGRRRSAEASESKKAKHDALRKQMEVEIDVSRKK